MAQKLKSHPKRKPNRYKEYDYSKPGYYFVTVCSNNRENIFGECKMPVPTTLSAIIGSFKSKASREYLQYINENNLKISGHIWQRSFYDHVIRTDTSLKNIREYIQNNPAVWDRDEYNPGHN